MAIKPIEILIRAKDEASGVLGSLQGKLVAVGAAVAAYFGVGAFAGAVKGAADLEQGMSRVLAATNASADEMKLLRQAAEDAGANTKYTSTQAAGALENLAKAGLSAKDAIAALPAVLDLAQAGDIELGQASEFLTKAVMGMGLAFSDAGRVADVLALGANATNTSVTGLAQALSYAAPVAQSLGLSLEATVAIIGKFADAGIDASRAGTALNSILSQFSDPASKFRQELGAAGITTGNFETALHQLAKAGPAGAKAILSVGQEAGPALRALLGQGMGALDDLTNKLKNAEGAAAAAAKLMNENLNGSIKGLESAWKYLKDTLGAPILPVLKEGVDQLAGAFRSAVAGGTITKFGESIATAFQAGIKWVREFAAQVDFTQLAADMRAFADRAGEIFTQIGQYATNAGGIIETAYGVMKAGANGVLTAIYGIGVAFAETAAFILKTGISINEGLQKISFGYAKTRLINETEEMRVALAGVEGVSTELGIRVQGSMTRMADGAQLARNGFAGLSKAATDSQPAIEGAGSSTAALTKELKAGAEAAVAAGIAYQKKVNAEQIAKQATDDHAASVRKLKAEYEAAVSTGNWQLAAEKIRELKKAADDAAAGITDLRAKAEENAKKTADAFVGLGVTSQASLKMAAESARIYFEQIKGDASSTAVDTRNAFKAMAEAAIAANDGVAPSWINAQAAAKGFEVAVDAAGKATLKAADEGKKSVDSMSQSFAQSAEQVKKYEEAMDKMLMKYKLSADYSEKQLDILEKENALIERRIDLENKRLNRDKEGFSLDTGGKRVNMAIDTQASTYERAKSQGLTEDQALKIAAQFINERGEKMGWQGGGFGGLNQGQTWGSELQKAIDKIKLENAATAAQAANGGNTQAPAAPINAPERTLPPATGSTNQVLWTRNVNISVNNMSMGNVPTNETGDATLERMIRKLAEASRASQ